MSTKPPKDVLQARARATIAQRNLLPPEPAPVVLMVSGGSDSVALARLFAAMSTYPLTILHVNHLLRGEDAAADERFVVSLAHELGLPCEVRRVDVAAQVAATGENLEQAGRVARYDAAEALLGELCRAARCAPEKGRIATAHTLDDRAETFLMRAIVGGGTGSLASIPYRNGRVIRPLLDCTRAELRIWLEGGGTHWREDATNADTSRLRAFVRHEVVPLLTTRNPDLLETLKGSMEALAGDESYLAGATDLLADAFLHIDRIPPTPCATLAVEALAQPTALARRLVRAACQSVMPSTARLTFEHIEQIVRNGEHVGFATDIPGDVTVRNVYGTLVFRRKTAGEQPRTRSDA